MIYSIIHGCDGLRLRGSQFDGLAYPQAGPHCCAVKLVSDGRIVGAVRADQFSAFAAEQRLRDGWCAFHIELKHDHFIFSDRLVLQCMVSGREIHAVEFDAVSWEDREAELQHSKMVPLGELLGPRAPSAQADIRAYQPLIDRVADRLNDEQYVAFAYRFILGRDADEAGKAWYVSIMRDTGDRNAILLDLLKSKEFTDNRRGRLPTPFDEQFAAVPLFLPLT